MAIRLNWIEIQGFRAFGAVRARLDFEGPLAIIAGPNSQGKTSVVEAIEFLLTGKTARREILASAKAEFAGCLRNVHLPPECPTLVRAELELDDGRMIIAERTLLEDYAPKTDCIARLTVDGSEATDLREFGLNLADPPLEAPVLLQHTLRYTLSARPQERSDYFRAVLEVADLQELFAELRSACEVPEPVSPFHAKLATCRSRDVLARPLAAISDAPLPSHALEDSLAGAVRAALVSLGQEEEAVPGSLSESRATLESALSEREAEVFPVRDLVPPAEATVLAPPEDFSPVLGYTETIEGVDREVERLTPVFRAVLDLPGMDSTEEPVDCPVCESPRSLAPERVQAMRDQLSRLSGIEAARSKALERLQEAQSHLQSVRSAARQGVPSGTRLGPADRRELVERQRALETAVTDEEFSAFVERLPRLADVVAAVDASVDRALGALAEARDSVAGGRPQRVEGLVAVLAAVAESYSKLEEARGAYGTEASRIIPELRQQAQKMVGVAEFGALVELAEDPDGLRNAILEKCAAAEVRNELARALKQVEKAIGQVFDNRFASLSKEISEWWERIRPGEPVEFSKLQRRGSGRRFVDLKASMKAGSATPAVERDAVGVFSDSQLNALGLSSFLGRWMRQPVGFIVLDDPVMASDEGHVETFSHCVVAALIDANQQVLISTYDNQLGKSLEYVYSHMKPDVFAVTMDNPASGSRVVRTSDQLEALIERAASFTTSESKEMRKTAASHLRDASERLCKEIVVKNRTAAGERCVVTDYDGQTLRSLMDLAVPYLSDPADPGKLRELGRVLNPGSHDDRPPVAASLRAVLSRIRELKKRYLKGSKR